MRRNFTELAGHDDDVFRANPTMMLNTNNTNDGICSERSDRAATGESEKGSGTNALTLERQSSSFVEVIGTRW